MTGRNLLESFEHQSKQRAHAKKVRKQKAKAKYIAGLIRYNKSCRRLTAADRRKIKSLRSRGLSYRAIADELDNKVSHVAIYDFLAGYNYKQ